MRLHARWVVAGASVLVVALSTVSAQITSRITHAIPRSPVYHVAGYDVFSPQVATAWGGVVAQADTIHWEGAPVANVSLALALDVPEGEGLHVEINGTTLFYPIDYDDLVPMALFVESGGTGLFTAFSNISLGQEFLQLAGTLPTTFNANRRVAFEFAGTRYERALNELDFCTSCLGDQRPDLVETVNASLDRRKDDASWPENRATRSYVVTDVGFEVIAQSDQDRLELMSGLARYNWFRSEGMGESWRLRIGSVVTVERPILQFDYSESLANAEARLADFEARFNDAHARLNELAGGELAIRLGEIGDKADQLLSWWIDERHQVVDELRALADEVRKTMEETEENAELFAATENEIGQLRETELLLDGFFIFETLALLRAARSTSASAFADFLDSLRRDELVMGRPAAWDLYTASFCRAYPAEPECEES